MSFPPDTRYHNGERFARECLGFDVIPSVNRYEVLTKDGMHLHLDSLNQISACARMYMQSIGTTMFIEIQPGGVVIRCQPMNCEGVEVTCIGDDIAVCDSVVLACLMVNQEMAANRH